MYVAAVRRWSSATPVAAVTARGAGVFLVARATGRALFLLRQDGTWGIPGGRRDGKESLQTTALRELTEETGYSGPVIMEEHPRLVTVFATPRGYTDQWSVPNKRFAYDIMYGEVFEEFLPVLDFEHMGFRWSDLSDLPSPLHPGVRIALRYVAR